MTPRGFFLAVCGVTSVFATIIGAGFGFLLWALAFYILSAVAFWLALRCRYEGWPTPRGAEVARQARRFYGD